jgi:hypothetical protein
MIGAERLEARSLLAVLTVNTTADDNVKKSPRSAPGSIRAITSIARSGGRKGALTPETTG